MRRNVVRTDDDSDSDVQNGAVHEELVRDDSCGERLGTQCGVGGYNGWS